MSCLYICNGGIKGRAVVMANNEADARKHFESAGVSFYSSSTPILSHNGVVVIKNGCITCEICVTGIVGRCNCSTIMVHLMM